MRKNRLSLSFIILIFIAPTVLIANDERTAELEVAAAAMERGIAGIPTQWFSMETAIGWEKMMLVFGYADNRTTCIKLIEIAKIDSPDRKFHCDPAN